MFLPPSNLHPLSAFIQWLAFASHIDNIITLKLKRYQGTTKGLLFFSLCVFKQWQFHLQCTVCTFSLLLITAWLRWRNLSCGCLVVQCRRTVLISFPSGCWYGRRLLFPENAFLLLKTLAFLNTVNFKACLQLVSRRACRVTRILFDMGEITSVKAFVLAASADYQRLQRRKPRACTTLQSNEMVGNFTKVSISIGFQRCCLPDLGPRSASTDCIMLLKYHW